MASARPARILVVDDELSLERLIKQRFRQQIKEKEFEFLFACNGKQALDLVQKSPTIDLILTDIRMPEMDGLALLEQMQQIDPTLKAIVVSAYDELKNIRTAMNRGAFDFITKPIDFNDLEVTIRKTLAFVREIREGQYQLQAAQEQLRHQAFYDNLTGLLNWNGFIEEIHNFFRTNQKSSDRLAVLLLDLDRYQTVKFSLGHQVGEQLLQEAVRRLKACVPQAAAIARVSANEFAVLLKDIPEANNTASAIHKVLEIPFILEGVPISATTSIGIADNSFGYEQPEDLLRAADTAMHYAKTTGKACTALFDIGMQAGAIERLHLEADLHRAIFQHQLHLNYQPIFSLANGQILGFEALVRWQHPTKGLVSPTEFIPVAEQTGLIVPLGEWVLSDAMRSLGIWQKRFPELHTLSMSVNLSGVQLSSPNLVTQIDEVLSAFSVSGNCLKLEITESILMENAGAASQLLEQLKARQVQVCIDDFGTGYSSLSYLHRLPIDTLKIDRAFISGMAADSKDFDIVKTIITLAHSLKLDVVAEGIETVEQLRWLRSLGCEWGQGFFFARPLSADAVDDLLASQLL